MNPVLNLTLLIVGIMACAIAPPVLVILGPILFISVWSYRRKRLRARQHLYDAEYSKAFARYERERAAAIGRL